MATKIVKSPTPFVTIKNITKKPVSIFIKEAGDVKTGILDNFSGYYKLLPDFGLDIREKRVDLTTIEKLAQQKVLTLRKNIKTLQFSYTVDDTGTA